ncbi:uncharacterized protein A4U43_C04F3160 [Asparagus officinalis]|uniref:C2H2-type domain-containing protein n=1 Tax=Asparagus officinalis TaxID=4686 RepID=A0A5P1EXU5_ASPOF|nr:uncharacterized protein A4U43_C04F3160 [Asparagus officinalis]
MKRKRREAHDEEGYEKEDEARPMANRSRNKKPAEEAAENDAKVYNCHHCSRTFNSSQALAGHCKRKVVVGRCKSHPSTKDEIPPHVLRCLQQRQREVPEAPPPPTPGQHFFHDPNYSRRHQYSQPTTSQSSYTNARKLACVPSQAAVTFYEPLTHLTRPVATPIPSYNHNPCYNQPMPSQSSNNVRNIAYAPSQAITFYEPFTRATRVTNNPNPNPNPNPSSMNGAYIRRPITCPMNRVYDRQPITSQSSTNVRNLAYAPSQAYGPLTLSTRVNTNPNPNLSSMIMRTYDHGSSSNGEKNNKEELDLTLRLGR